MTEQEEYQEYLEYQNYLKSKGVEKTLSSGETIEKQASNLIPSAMNLAKSLTMPLHSPVQFSQNFGNMVMGGVEKLIPGTQKHEVYADNLADYYKDSYGSWDKIKNKAMNDPFGMWADASGFGALATTPLRATSLGKAANQAAVATDPVNVLLNAPKPVIKAVTPKDMPKKWMKESVKSSFKVDNLDANINTMLDEGIVPTYKGMQKADSVINDVGNQLDALIKESSNSGAKVHRSVIFQYLTDLKNKLSDVSNATDAVEDVAKMQAMADRAFQYLVDNKGEYLTAKQLNDFKRKQYDKINYNAKNLKGEQVADQTRKAMARGAKDGVESVIPEAHNLNARQGALLELMPELSKAARRIEGNYPWGLMQGVTTGIGHQIFGPVGAAVGAAYSTLKHPMVQPHAAIWLNKLKNQGLLGMFGDNALSPALMREGILQSGRVNDSDTK